MSLSLWGVYLEQAFRTELDSGFQDPPRRSLQWRLGQEGKREACPTRRVRDSNIGAKTSVQNSLHNIIPLLAGFSVPIKSLTVHNSHRIKTQISLILHTTRSLRKIKLP